MSRPCSSELNGFGYGPAPSKTLRRRGGDAERRPRCRVRMTGVLPAVLVASRSRFVSRCKTVLPPENCTITIRSPVTAPSMISKGSCVPVLGTNREIEDGRSQAVEDKDVVVVRRRSQGVRPVKRDGARVGGDDVECGASELWNRPDHREPVDGPPSRKSPSHVPDVPPSLLPEFDADEKYKAPAAVTSFTACAMMPPLVGE